MANTKSHQRSSFTIYSTSIPLVLSHMWTLLIEKNRSANKIAFHGGEKKFNFNAKFNFLVDPHLFSIDVTDNDSSDSSIYVQI